MYQQILKFTSLHKVALVAVSKTRPLNEIKKLYDQGQRIFGENKVQDMVQKHELLPPDIDWHFIGHLQKNKVRYIASFVRMIHSIDSLALLQVVDKEAAKNKRIIPVLLQFHIAKEETKFGLNINEAVSLLQYLQDYPLNNISIFGVMGMASLTNDSSLVRSEFKLLKSIFDDLKTQYFSDHADFCEISMGMSGDYRIAIEEGSSMVRIGSAIFE